MRREAEREAAAAEEKKQKATAAALKVTVWRHPLGLQKKT